MPRTKQSLKRKFEGDDESEVNAASADIPCLPSSLLSKRAVVEQAFYAKLPDDYLWFYHFCCELCTNDPLGAIENITGLRLVGPFELLHMNSPSLLAGEGAQFYRFFHDPPEFVTLLAGKDALHFGCFRDLPTQMPCAIVGFDPPDSGKMKVYASNLFEFLNNQLKTDTSGSLPILKKLRAFSARHKIPIDNSVSDIRRSRTKLVCSTLNSMGLFIELKQGDIGYRPLSVTYDKLTSMLQAAVSAGKENQLSKFESVDELITFAQFACDEGDYGQSIELGLSLLAFKPKGLPDEKSSLLNSRIRHLLSVGYSLANRPEFAKVIRDHMDDRRLQPRVLPAD